MYSSYLICLKKFKALFSTKLRNFSNTPDLCSHFHSIKITFEGYPIVGIKALTFIVKIWYVCQTLWMKKKDILMVLWYPHILQSYLLFPRWIIKNFKKRRRLQRCIVGLHPIALNVVDLRGSVSLSFRWLTDCSINTRRLMELSKKDRFIKHPDILELSNEADERSSLCTCNAVTLSILCIQDNICFVNLNFDNSFKKHIIIQCWTYSYVGF